MELLPDFDALVRWVKAAGLLTAVEAGRLRRRWEEPDRASRALDAARELRESLRKEVLAWEAGGALHRSTIDALNQLMSKHPLLTRLASTPKALAKETWFAMREPEDLLAPVAHSAATLFTEADRCRVRKCGQCVLHFYDTSKKGTRRWCSMQLCGNRLKVAAYATRRHVL